MSVAIRIDRAVFGDLDAILALLRLLAYEHELFDPSFAVADNWTTSMESYLTERLRSGEHYVAVAREGSALVGVVVASLRWQPVFAESPRGYLENVVVAPSRRRSGLGRQLVEVASRWCEARGAQAVELSVAMANEAGLAFWTAMGFSPILMQMRRPRGGGPCDE